MKTVKIFIIIFLFLTFDQAFQKSVLANDKWLKVRSENFLLIGDAAEKDIQQTAFKLEKFREVFIRQFSNIKFNSPIPTNVIVFKSDSSLNIYKQNNKFSGDSSGYFQIGEDTNYIVISIEKPNTNSFQNIYHQYAHFLIDNAIGKSKIPPWFYEGLAEYYQDFQIDENGKSRFGNTNSNYLKWLANNQLIPFETFLNIDYYTLRQQEKAEGEGLYYAQAWALTCYLMQENNRAKSQKFIEQITSGKSIKEALNNSFQISLSEFEQNFKNFIDQKNFPNPQEILSSSLNLDTSTISEAEAETFLANLLYTLNRFDEAETHLNKALNLEPNLSFAVSTLGLIKVRQFNYDEARILGEKAIENEDRDYLTYFRYAYILSRRGMTEYGFVSGYNFADSDKMREALKKAINLNPDFAESYNLYALISFVRNDEIDESLKLINNAIQIAPGNQQYLIRFAELNMRKEKFFDARKTALTVFQTAAEPGLRLYVQNTLQRIDSTEAQLLQSKRNREMYINDDKVTDAPMSEEEIARRRAKAMLDSIRIGLRKPVDGQKRISGTLIEIECQTKQINFVFKTEKEIVKLHANSFEGINLMTYNQNMFKTEIGCGLINKENNAVIIYRETKDDKMQISGEIVSIEFVPKEFKLTSGN